MRKLLFLEFRNREQSVSYVLITIRFQSLKFDLIVDEMKHTIFSGFFSLVQKYPISKHNPTGSLNQKFHSSSHDIRKYIIFLIPCTLQQSIEALVEICLPRKRRKNIGICAVNYRYGAKKHEKLLELFCNIRHIVLFCTLCMPLQPQTRSETKDNLEKKDLQSSILTD